MFTDPSNRHIASLLPRPSHPSTLVLQAANTGVRRPGYKANLLQLRSLMSGPLQTHAWHDSSTPESKNHTMSCFRWTFLICTHREVLCGYRSERTMDNRVAGTLASQHDESMAKIAGVIAAGLPLVHTQGRVWGPN